MRTWGTVMNKNAMDDLGKSAYPSPKVKSSKMSKAAQQWDYWAVGGQQMMSMRKVAGTTSIKVCTATAEKYLASVL